MKRVKRSQLKSSSVKDKADYVRSQGQSRQHHCHWPGCEAQVPPAKWGCRRHWYMLPQSIRNQIWAAYQIGQEVSMTPSREYVRAAREAQAWIARHYPDDVKPTQPKGVGVNQRTGKILWHRGDDGFFCGDHYHRTPDELLNECLITAVELLQNYPELRKTETATKISKVAVIQESFL